MAADMKNFIDPVKELRDDVNLKSNHKLNNRLLISGENNVYDPPNKYDSIINKEKVEEEFVIAEALKNGATDDGQIVKWAYDQNVGTTIISSIKKMLRSMKCRSKVGCAHKHDRMSFINVMTSCVSKTSGCSFLQYDLSRYYDTWKKNRDEQYSDSIGHKVIVEGKISKIKEVSRFKNDKFIHIHLFDTKLRAKDLAKAENVKYTRDLWVEIPKNRMVEFDMSSHFCLEDTIAVTGKIGFHNYFGDYWLGDVAHMETIKRRGGVPAVRY
jgi:hypothetical protein